MHDLSYQEVSHFLDIPVSAVKARLHKARKQLKERLLMMIEQEFEEVKPKEEFTKRVMLAIGGRVVSAKDGSPIADAKVILDYRTHTFTDEEGNYQIRVESGQVTERRLWIRARGYPTYFQRFRTNWDQLQADLDVALDAEVEASISGRLVTEDGKPVEGIALCFAGGGYGIPLPDQPKTDANGYFRYDGLKPSRRPYRLSTTQSDYPYKELTFNIDRPGHFDLGGIVLKSGKTVSGRVANAQGDSVANVYVHAGPHPSIKHDHDTKAQTDADGRYILRNVDWAKDGTAYVMVFARGYGMETQKVDFGKTQVLDGVDFQLETGAQISGRLTNEGSKPLEGRKVELLTLSFQDTNYSWLEDYLVDETDAEGRFCIEGLPRGGREVKLRLRDLDYNYFNFDANQSPIEVNMTDLHLVELRPPDAQIAGTVVNAQTGQPIPKFHIKLGQLKKDNTEEMSYHNIWGRWDYPYRAATYVSPDGNFTIGKLEPKTKKCLLVTAPGYTATEAGPFEATRQPDASRLIIMMQRGKKIRGVVTDSESGQPIHCAVVTYFSPIQPCTHERQILPHRIPAVGILPNKLPQGGETICAKKNGEYEITTAQNEDNYLLVTAPGYDTAVVGPVEITEAALSLPIALTKKQNSQASL